jgi:response regulator RpfG family c-di-GMP phosphodiesterase
MSGPLILVIEDNPPLRRMLAVTLRTSGYRVLEAGDGSSALALAAGELPALVIQDLMLPDMEALALLRALREFPAADGPQLPVIAVSGSEEKLAELRAEPDSFTQFLLKPVDSARLLRIVAGYAPVARPEAPRRAVRHRVLLADDDPVQRKLTRLHLARLGFEVTTVDDGAEALAAARATPPDLIVSDVLMPVLDGFELCHAVRSDPVLQRTPVVLASSAYVAAEDRELALAAGAADLVERGPDLAAVIDAVNRCLERRPMTAPVDLGTFAQEHARRVRAQLDLQARENRELRERAAVSAVDLSVLAGISGAVARARGRAGLLAEALPRCLEAGGLAAASVWLHDETDTLVEAAHVGPHSSVVAMRERLRVALRQAPLDWALFEPPGPAAQPPLLCARLGPSDAPLGVLAFAWRDGDLADTRTAFTRAIAGQMSEGLALERAFEELETSRAETISRLALAAESRDGVTARHTERVSAFAALLATRAGLTRERTELIRVASLMHDIGKIGVSDAILLKPGPLTGQQFEQMKRHTTIGHRILSGSDVELLQVAATIALSHHERVDGTGYPNALAGRDIPIEGRIVAIADVFDSLTNDRVYRRAMSVPEAVEIMVAGRGSHFDAQLLDILLESLDEIVLLAAA